MTDGEMEAAGGDEVPLAARTSHSGGGSGRNEEEVVREGTLLLRLLFMLALPFLPHFLVGIFMILLTLLLLLLFPLLLYFLRCHQRSGHPCPTEFPDPHDYHGDSSSPSSSLSSPRSFSYIASALLPPNSLFPPSSCSP